MIETRRLTKVFLRRGEQVKAVDGVTVKIIEGEFVAVVGRSGAGKTTLLNLIGALDQPTSGTVKFKDKEISNVSKKGLSLLRREKIGFIFQDFNLLPTLTSFENIEVALALATMKRDKLREKVNSLLDSVGLSNRADHFPSELSVGQRQKLAIARALANDPVLLLADEPTGEMDPTSGREIASRLFELNRECNVTVVVASHGAFPYHKANRTLFMKDGKLVSKEKAGY